MITKYGNEMINETAEKYGIKDKKKFNKFLHERFGKAIESQPDYVDDWASRWNNPRVCNYADQDTEKILKKYKKC